MNFSTVAAVVAVLSAPLFVRLGDYVNGSWQVAEPWLGIWYAVTYVVTLVVGFAGLFLSELARMDTFTYAGSDGVVSEDMFYGAVIWVTMFCFGYLYGFSAGPFRNGGYAFVDGFLLFGLLGFIPIVMCFFGEKYKSKQTVSQTEPEVATVTRLQTK